MSQCVPERNHDGFLALAGEGKFEVTRVFELATKLAKLIGNRMHNVSAMIRKRYLHVAADDSRRTDIQELTCNHEAVAFRLRFNLDINFVRGSAIERLSRSHPAPAHARQPRL